MSLVALALALTVTQESPLPMFEYGTLTNNGYVSHLAIDKAGHWVAGNREGKVSPEELARVTAAIDSARLVTYEGPKCSTTPPVQLVRIERGELRFSLHCGREAHPSVTHLITLVESVTSRKPSPTLVRLYRWRFGDEERKEAIILKENGVWSTDTKVGSVGGKDLVELLTAFQDPELELTPSALAPDCRGDYPHQLELPGRGVVLWLVPCQSPGPKLSAALDKLFAVVGLSR